MCHHNRMNQQKLVGHPQHFGATCICDTAWPHSEVGTSG